MITRTLSAAYLNTVANNPEVRPFLGRPDITEPLDLSPLVENPANVTLTTDGGGWVLQSLLPGVYELHTLMLPSGRGKTFFAAAREALNFMFTRTDCLEIVTRCPDDNPGARSAANLSGFRERFRHGEEGEGISFQTLTLDDWLARDRFIRKEGRALLDLLGEAELPSEALERLAGAAVMMIRGRQTSKAVGVFNRTAAFAGYPTIVALGDDLVDVRGAIVHVKDDGLEVMLIR